MSLDLLITYSVPGVPDLQAGVTDTGQAVLVIAEESVTLGAPGTGKVDALQQVLEQIRVDQDRVHRDRFPEQYEQKPRPMRGYREIRKPTDGARPAPGRVFYTIRADDVGLGTLKTDEGPIHVNSFMGRVQAIDVGKRVYHVPCDDPRAPWIWQVENNEQRDERLARKRAGQ